MICDAAVPLAPPAALSAPAPAVPGGSDVVLVVDDVPDNLAMLHDALDESGYTVLLATRGEAALQRAAQALPDIILLDALMPGMDGFEVARRLKAAPATAHIPIIFMTGLTETEHLVAALEAGGIDYVTKPIKPREVLARMGVHLGAARRARQDASQAHQARNALDAFGCASITLRAGDGRILWQTPLARELLQGWFGATGPWAPESVRDWLRRHVLAENSAGPPAPARTEPAQLNVEQGARRLTFRLHQQAGDSAGGGDWLIVMRESSDAQIIGSMGLAFGLTAREAEVLYWVVKGKINRDIGAILGASPATVKKHLERVFAKLGVETRTAAAAMALNRVRLLPPQFGG
ncbi:response regulator [Verminephrobacter aporrectodeae]|uniref:response regulator n=1 Tax=Verminephrobacter aporrectodeae TaxID=1110389 RepID=UPI002243DCB6|nr:response regulator [Verminephrobacter aporrectodeae]